MTTIAHSNNLLGQSYLVRDLQWLAKARWEDKTDERAIADVWASPSPHGQYLWASDGHRAHGIATQLPEGASIPGALVAAYKRAPTRIGGALVSLPADPNPGVRYPLMDTGVIPHGAPHATYTVDAQALAALASVEIRKGASDHPRVAIDPRTCKVCVVQTSVSECPSEWIYLDPRYVYDAVYRFDTLTMEVRSPLDPVVWHNADKTHIAVVMPMRL